MSSKDLLEIPIVGPTLYAIAEATKLAHQVKKMRQTRIGIGKIVSGDPTSAPFILEPGEMIVPKQTFRKMMYTLNPSQKCYNARKNTKLKTLLKRYKK